MARSACLAMICAAVLAGCFDFSADVARCRASGGCGADSGFGGGAGGVGGGGGTDGSVDDGGGLDGSTIVLDAGRPPAGACTDAGVCLEHPLPTADLIVSVAGGGTDKWYLTRFNSLLHEENGTLVRYDIDRQGQTFGAFELPGGPLFIVGSGGMFGRFDVDGGFTQLLNTSAPDLYSVWGASDSDLWLVGAQRTIVEWVSNTPAFVSTSQSDDLYFVHGNAADFVYTGGSSAVLFAKVSGGWNVEPWPGQSGGPIRDLYVNGNGNVVVASTTQIALRDLTPNWQTLTSPVDAGTPSAIFIASNGSVFLGTSGGGVYTVSMSQPSEWTRIDYAPGDSTITRIWEPEPGVLEAVGAAGTILRGTNGGSQWGKPPSRTPLNAVFASSPALAVAVGASGTVKVCDGQTWGEEQVPDTLVELTSVTSANGTVVAAGTYGRIFYRAGPGDWRRHPLDGPTSLKAMATVDGVATAVGSAGTIVRIQPSDGGLQVVDGGLGAANFTAIAARGTRALILADDGAMVAADAGSWYPMGNTASLAFANELSICPNGRVFVGGQGVNELVGASYFPISLDALPVTALLCAEDNTLYAASRIPNTDVGRLSVMRPGEAHVSTVKYPTEQIIEAIAQVPGTGDIVFVGNGSAILRKR